MLDHIQNSVDQDVTQAFLSELSNYHIQHWDRELLEMGISK